MNQPRNEQIKQLYINHYSYAEIGRIYGISRQRVHQIAKGYKSFAQSNLSYVNTGYGNLGCICKMCNGRSKVVHHIDHNSANNRWDNLLPLCEKCHKTIHKRGYKKRVKESRNFAS